MDQERILMKLQFSKWKGRLFSALQHILFSILAKGLNDPEKWFPITVSTEFLH